jgi:hypothetical protein
MHIDESSLEGTLRVLDTIITKTLKLSDEGLRKHGIVKYLPTYLEFICTNTYQQ